MCTASRRKSRERERESKGCPIGNLTSQLFANIYLNELDQYVRYNLKVRSYIRYTDDFVITHHNPEYLIWLKNKIEIFLKSKLELQLHPDKVSLRKYGQGIDFLGYVILPHAIVLRTKTKRRMWRKLNNKVFQFKQGEITEEKFIQTLNSYLAVLSHANTHKLRDQIMHKLWAELGTLDY